MDFALLVPILCFWCKNEDSCSTITTTESDSGINALASAKRVERKTIYRPRYLLSLSSFVHVLSFF